MDEKREFKAKEKEERERERALNGVNDLRRRK